MSTVFTSPAHQEALRRAGAPKSSELVEYVAWIFGWSVDEAGPYIKAAWEWLEDICPLDSQAVRNLAMPCVIEACRVLGLPCNPRRHEQPHQLMKMFAYPRASLSLHEFMTHEDDEERPMELFVPVLLILWGWKLHEIASKNRSDLADADAALVETLYGLHRVAIRVMLFLWPARHVRVAYLGLLRVYTRYLICTRGCFDLVTGDLIDRETPAMREFASAWGPDEAA